MAVDSHIHGELIPPPPLAVPFIWDGSPDHTYLTKSTAEISKDFEAPPMDSEGKISVIMDPFSLMTPIFCRTDLAHPFHTVCYK